MRTLSNRAGWRVSRHDRVSEGAAQYFRSPNLVFNRGADFVVFRREIGVVPLFDELALSKRLETNRAPTRSDEGSSRRSRSPTRGLAKPNRSARHPSSAPSPVKMSHCSLTDIFLSMPVHGDLKVFEADASFNSVRAPASRQTYPPSELALSDERSLVTRPC